jgi:hypothetical protein
MAIRKEHDPFEKSAAGIIANTADAVGNVTRSFLTQAGFRNQRGRLGLKGPLLVVAALGAGQVIAPFTPDASDIPAPSTINDIAISGVFNDLNSYVYTEVGNQAAYVLLKEDSRFELYMSPNTSQGTFSDAFTFVEDANQAQNMIERHIIPNLEAGVVHEEADNFTGYDHLEFCPLISEPSSDEETGNISRSISCNPYPENTDDWVAGKLSDNEAFWQDAAQNISVTSYGFSAAELETTTQVEPLSQGQQGLLYTLYMLGAGAGFAGVGTAVSAARQKRENYYRKNP